ncbi:vitamin K epoxide reductase [Cellulomonas sp. Leaf395]|nr:vitamin K epoxide reductase family protein [Cellulomonas sp. Leaf395]KQT02641.1 vitamin K epoxide reductase [Cellulomonas sp. Leaf395]
MDELDEVDPDPDLLLPPSQAWRARTAIEMVISGVLGLLASFVLSIEALTLAADPNASFGCDLNSVISCSVVAQSWQASLFGFPNAFLGIAAEAVVITVAVAVLGGVRFPRWFMLGAQTIYTLGFLFAWWLFYEAYVVIGALCPWCLLITVTTTLVWAGLTRLNVREGAINFPGRWGPAARRFVDHGNDWFVTIALIVLLAVAIFAKYGSIILA